MENTKADDSGSDNPYLPPAAVVTDVDAPPRSSWLRTWVTLILLVPAAQAVAWVVVPILALNIANGIHKPAKYGDDTMLMCDLVLSFLDVVAFTFAGAKIAKGRAFTVGVVMALVGWLLWLFETLDSGAPFSFPVWYELFPNNFGAALLGAYLAVRTAHGASQSATSALS
jgi:hypothetical protein